MKRTVLITGASRGIGRATAVLFAQNGYNVLINYNNSKEKAEFLRKKLSEYKGIKVLIYKADVSKANEVNAMINFAKQNFGKIDVLVNNAGIAEQKLFGDISEDDWKRMFSVNVDGIFHCCKAVLPDMIRRKEGKIINISSIWGLVGASCEVHYSAAKAAVIGFTKALAKEVGPSNIQVNCIAPGVIATEMNANLNEETLKALKEETPLERIGKAGDIANSILFLASDKAEFITGQTISPNGGFVI